MALKRKKREYESEVNYVFRCYGHGNIRAKHEKTIEFTKDGEISVKADCIIGVRADFDLEELREFRDKVLVVVECGDFQDEFHAIVNPDFSDEREMVLRKSRYSTARTFGVMLSKGAAGLKREIVRMMRDPGREMIVTVHQKPVRRMSARGSG